MSNDWLYTFKRKILIGVTLLLGASLGAALVAVALLLRGNHLTYGATQVVILLSGASCLLVLILFLSQMIDRYIDELVLKDNEIGLVCSIIDNISKTLDIEELEKVSLDIISNAFDADEVDILLPFGSNDYRLVRRLDSGERIPLEKPEFDEATADMVQMWVAGTDFSQSISLDGNVIYLPVSKGGTRLALFVVRCWRHPFPHRGFFLVGAICNHIAIAFENARLYSIAITDELTGLFTVRHFRDCIDRQYAEFDRYGEKFALLMIDIDDFKHVNDAHGHVTGDEVLRRVARCIADCIRSVDLGFRYGGEEFAVILPVTGAGGGLFVAERIRAMVEGVVVTAETGSISVTVSIGLSICPGNAVTVKDLITAADQALYAAKHHGKNCTFRSNHTAPPSLPEPAVAPVIPAKVESHATDRLVT